MSEENPLKDLLEGLERFGQGFSEIGRILADWHERMRPRLDSFVEAARLVGDGFSLWLAVSVTTFARGGWSEIPLGSMDLSESTALVEQLYDKPAAEIERELDVAIPEYFRRNDYAPLSEMVDSWSLHFRDRHQVFEDALWAHKQGRYTLSIPTLATQVEGVVRDLTREYGRAPDEWKKAFGKPFGYDPKKSPTPASLVEVAPGFMDLPIHERLEKVEELRRHFTLFRINELFKDGDFDNPEFVSSVNRHAILHGVFRNFGEFTSLKLFFILDLLHESVGIYKELVAGPRVGREEGRANP